MRNLTIDGKEYTIEFQFEAALYNDCTEKITTLMYAIGKAQDNSDIKNMLNSMSDIPQVALTMFYAGLLEHHGADAGDGSVRSMDDAKDLLRKYFKEHKEDGTGNFFSLMEMLMEVMGDDGFFDQIGLTQMIQEGEKQTKQPQDHRKKNTKATAN